MQIGRIDEGIVYSAWSPDEEILTLCTAARQVVLMSKVLAFIVSLLPSLMHSEHSMHHMQEWDVLAEEPLDSVLEPESDSNPNPEDNLSDACITWRGDGKYFATVSAPGQGQRFLQLRNKLQHLISFAYLLASVRQYDSHQHRPLCHSPVHGSNRNPFSSDLVKFDEEGAGNDTHSPHTLQTTCIRSCLIAWFENTSKMATSTSLGSLSLCQIPPSMHCGHRRSTGQHRQGMDQGGSLTFSGEGPWRGVAPQPGLAAQWPPPVCCQPQWLSSQSGAV